VREGARQADLIVTQPVQQDLDSRRRPLPELGGELGVLGERPGTVPVGNDQQRVAMHPELVEQAIQHVEPSRVCRRDVVHRDEQL